MARKPKDNRQLVIATWPGRTGADYFDRNWGDWRHMDDCLSCWLKLRVYADGKDLFYDTEEQAVRNIGIYVWVSRDGTVSLDLRLHDIYSLELHEAESRYKTLKAMHAKARKAGACCGRWTFVKTRNLRGELEKLLAALKIKNAMEYHGVGTNETITPIGNALDRICEEIEKQVQRQGGWKEQPVEEPQEA